MTGREYDAAMDRALKYLGPKPRSRKDVAAALERSGYGLPAVDEVLARLEELSILDDVAFAQEAARQGRSKGMGAEAVKRDLELRGVAGDTVEAVISQSFPVSDERELALAAASKRAASLKGLPPAAQYRRLAGYLARRGHPPDLVTDACSVILGELAGSD